MGCGTTKESRALSGCIKSNQAASQQAHANKSNQLSLYTVREELSEMEQSYAPSKRQSVINPNDPILK
ncbi:hypothetical protein SteCoe_17167 [Stentor coeruleus]|uniref:Uncharacterized protein n=1 Tax=Stentor coeruleus TaxID=5963 RepID=A0A1R2BZK1_9CILI|nr:hypothetical protein SteCoe_17167 [Stentor coeruleus]